MNLFVDTAAILAILNADDQYHQPALTVWAEFMQDGSILYTSNYVILETTALLQHRFGLDAVRLFQMNILPVIEILWVDDDIHRHAISALLAANRRNLSLVDCASFEIMRQANLDTVFTFDPHFEEQGFKKIPQQ